MTLEERTNAANAELKEIGKWLNYQRRRRYAELNARLGATRRFENSDENYRDLYVDFGERCLAILKKYDLPPDTKIKLW